MMLCVALALLAPVDGKLRGLRRFGRGSGSFNSNESSSSEESSSEPGNESPQGPKKASILTEARCGGVIITEFMYDPTDEKGGDSKGEWIEILNDSCEEVDLTGWKVGDTSKRTTMQALGGGMTLKAGEYALIVGEDYAARTTFSIPGNTRIFMADNAVIGNRLNDNGRDEVFLVDANGNASDRVTYKVGACTGGSNGSIKGAAKGGMSMERRDPLGPSDCSNFFPSAVVGGSPGSENPGWSGRKTYTPCSCTEAESIRLCESVIITEVMYDPAGRDFGHEWVEIRNNGVTDVDLSGWRFEDLNESDEISAGGGSLVLSPGEYAVIVETDRPSASLLPDGTRTFTAGKLLGNGLKNSGDTLFIVNKVGLVVDTITYSDVASSGKTLERIDTGSGFRSNFRESDHVGGTPGKGTPGIENAEPACMSQCKPKKLHVCLAIDRSGSICNIKRCRGVKNCGCEYFASAVSFASSFITRTDALPETNEFAVVAFASNAYVKTSLTSAEDAAQTVQALRYTSGYTNTSQALQFCSEELDKGDIDAVRVILMITDGSPTRPYTTGQPKFQEAMDEATKQANAAKESDGTTLITVLVESSTSSADYLKSLSSDGYFLNVDNPENLTKVLNSLLDLIQCA
jgi:uncharacterized protein YegL